VITELMDYCRNHFIRTSETLDLIFAVDESTYTISGAFTDHYTVGQYVYIYGTVLNDGAYKITAVADEILTVNSIVTAEDTSDNDVTPHIFGCAVPRSFIALDTEITTWVAANQKVGVASEKIDDYSITQSAGAQQGWAGAFAARLNQYRKIFDDIERCIRYGY